MIDFGPSVNGRRIVTIERNDRKCTTLPPRAFVGSINDNTYGWVILDKAAERADHKQKHQQKNTA